MELNVCLTAKNSLCWKPRLRVVGGVLVVTFLSLLFVASRVDAGPSLPPGGRIIIRGGDTGGGTSGSGGTGGGIIVSSAKPAIGTTPVTNYSTCPHAPCRY